MSTPRVTHKFPIVWDQNNLSQPIFVADFRHVEITAVGTGNIQILASKDFGSDPGNPLATPPDFSLPSTINNSYAAVEIYDETVATGNFTLTLTVAGSTKIGELEANFDGWICVSRDNPAVDAFITVADNK